MKNTASLVSLALILALAASSRAAMVGMPGGAAANAGASAQAARAALAVNSLVGGMSMSWRGPVASFLSESGADRASLVAGLQGLPALTPSRASQGLLNGAFTPEQSRQVAAFHEAIAADPALAAAKMLVLAQTLANTPGAGAAADDILLVAKAAMEIRSQLGAEQQARMAAFVEKNVAALGGLKELPGTTGDVAAGAALTPAPAGLGRYTGEREARPSAPVDGYVSVDKLARPVAEAKPSFFRWYLNDEEGGAKKALAKAGVSLLAVAGLAAAAVPAGLAGWIAGGVALPFVLWAALAPKGFAVSARATGGFLGGGTLALAGLGALIGAPIAIIALGGGTVAAWSIAAGAAATLGGGILSAANVFARDGAISESLEPASDAPAGRKGALIALGLGWGGAKVLSFAGIAFTAGVGLTLLFIPGGAVFGAANLAGAAIASGLVWGTHDLEGMTDTLKTTAAFVLAAPLALAAAAAVIALGAWAGLAAAPFFAAATVGWLGVSAASVAPFAGAAAGALAAGSAVLGVSMLPGVDLSNRINPEGSEGAMQGLRGAAWLGWKTGLFLSILSIPVAAVAGLLLLPGVPGAVLLSAAGVSLLTLWGFKSLSSLKAAAAFLPTYLLLAAAAVAAVVGAGVGAALLFPAIPYTAGILAAGAVGGAYLLGGVAHERFTGKTIEERFETLDTGALSGLQAAAKAAWITAAGMGILSLMAVAGLGLSWAMVAAFSIPLATASAFVFAGVCAIGYGYLAFKYPHIFLFIWLMSSIGSSSR